MDSKIEGWFCSGWVFEKCTLKEIDAFAKSKDGQQFEFVQRLNSVDDYNPKQERCWLKNRQSKYHAFKLNSDNTSEYLGVPDSVTFSCKRSN